MDLYNKVYSEALLKNTSETAKWKQYEQEHLEVKCSLDMYMKQFKVDILIPVGTKAFLPGHLYHTGEVMASHGAGYFSECSVEQAKLLVDHRLNAAREMLQKYDRERELFTDKMEVPFAEDAFGGQEIIEEYNEEQEKIWREHHRKRVKEQKLHEVNERKQNKLDSTDRELMERLEELELMEELEEEIDGLDVSVENDDQLRRLMSGELKMNEKTRLAHNRTITNSSATENHTSMPNDAQVESSYTNNEVCEIETTDEESSASGDEFEDNISPAFLKLLQTTKSMNKHDKIETFKQELKEIKLKLKQPGTTIEEKVDLYDLSYELEEALDFLQPSWEETNENGEKRKKAIKFANDVSVKIIDDEEVVSKKTLELKVNHTGVAFQLPEPGESNEVRSPVDIYRLFEHCTAKEQTVASSKLETKSILKKRIATPTEEITNRETNTKEKSAKPVIDIIGEIVEHKTVTLEGSVVKATESTEPKKVSRFKQRRQ